MSLTHAPDRLEVIHDDVESTSSVLPEGQPDEATSEVPSEAGPETSTRPTFTITDAATSCSVSRKTITRKLPELAGYGAAKDDDGVWRIPVEALLAVGLHPGRSLQAPATPAVRPGPAPAPAPKAEQETVTISRERWDDVRIRLARAEAEAAERALALADARLALRALTAGPVRGESRDTATSTLVEPVRGTSPDPTTGPVEALPIPVDPLQGAVGGSDPRPSSQVDTSPAGSAAQPAPQQLQQETGPAEAPSIGTALDDVVAARNQAARTGGYVPASSAAGKKRRWWHAK